MADLPVAHGLASRVCARLDPVVAQYGFTPGQVGYGADSFGVTFCAGYEDFHRRFPHIHTGNYGNQQPRCVDITLHGDVTRGITRVDLEGGPVAGLVTDKQLAARLRRLEDDGPERVDDCLDDIAEALVASLSW